MKSPANLGGSNGAGESIQQELFERPGFSPVWPKHATHAERALKMLLAGLEITHPDFQDVTRSWRLGAYVKVLRELGWPIETHEIAAPTPDCATRFIAKYTLPRRVIDELGSVR